VSEALSRKALNPPTNQLPHNLHRRDNRSPPAFIHLLTAGNQLAPWPTPYSTSRVRLPWPPGWPPTPEAASTLHLVSQQPKSTSNQEAPRQDSSPRAPRNSSTPAATPSRKPPRPRPVPCPWSKWKPWPMRCSVSSTRPTWPTRSPPIPNSLTPEAPASRPGSWASDHLPPTPLPTPPPTTCRHPCEISWRPFSARNLRPS
jgi:hypothetical protein